jgi:hypothetical protein
MSFTYDLTTAIGKVRLALGDTTDGTGPRPDGSNFEDEELDTFLVLEDDDVELATARALEVLATQWASRADLQVGPRKESLSQIAARYAEQATAVRGRCGAISSAASVGVIDLGFAQVGDTSLFA